MNTLSQMSATRKLSSLQSIELAVNDACRALGVDDGKAYLITLAVSELASNMIRHGSSHSPTPDDISVKILSSASSLQIVLKDDCDPLPADVVKMLTEHDGTMTPFDTTIGNLPESGWGLDIIHSTAESVSYVRKKDKNVYEVAFDLDFS